MLPDGCSACAAAGWSCCSITRSAMKWMCLLRMVTRYDARSDVHCMTCDWQHTRWHGHGYLGTSRRCAEHACNAHS